MKKEKIKRIIYSIIVGLLFLHGEVKADELVIISNQVYPVDKVSIGTVKDIYLGAKTKEGSVRIRAIDQNDPLIRKAFMELVLGTTIESFQSHWFKKIFQEGGNPPVVKESSKEVIELILSVSSIPPLLKGSSKDVIEYVKNNSGAIGYVRKDEAAGVKGLKVLMSIDIIDRKH